MQNVAKYPKAISTTVRLAETEAYLQFEIEDDGRGFKPSETGYGTGQAVWVGLGAGAASPDPSRPARGVPLERAL